MFPNASSEVLACQHLARVAGVGALLLGLVLGGTGRAGAQTLPEWGTASDDAIALLSPRPHRLDNPLLKPGREYRGIALGDWLFYPTIIAGAVVHDNLVWSSARPLAAGGFNLGGQALLQRDTGMHKTSLYGDVDAAIFPTEGRANTVNGKIGLSHVWEVQRDFSVTAKAEYTHRSTPIGGGTLFTTTGPVPLISPQTYDRFAALLAVRKTFGKAFVGAAFETVSTSYAPLNTGVGRIPQNYRDSWTNTVSVRGGLWFSPMLYAFTEAAGNHRAYDHDSQTSRGYRVVAGIGSDRVSLFRGEVFGGYQQQFYQDAALGQASMPVIGGRLFWYPTRALTFRAMVDQAFSDVTLPTPGNPVGNPGKVITSALHIDYKLAREWSATVHGAYEHSTYAGSTRRDDGWRAGARVNYDINRSLGLTVGYDFSRVNSSVAGASFSRNVVNFNVKYRY